MRVSKVEVCLVVDQTTSEPGLELDIATVVEQIQPRLARVIQPFLAGSSQVQVNTLTSNTLIQRSQAQGWDAEASIFIYPLTLNLPAGILPLSDRLYQTCRDLAGLRRQVTQLGYQTGVGCFWLPIALTQKGPLYGEVIGVDEFEIAFRDSQPDRMERQYLQPLHLSDRWRQPLYQLAWQLLQSLAAPPATYLLEFGILGGEVCFDRLWPFPAKPAIASLGIQTPDLFTCHWLCLAGLPVTDLIIPGTVPHHTYPYT